MNLRFWTIAAVEIPDFDNLLFTLPLLGISRSYGNALMSGTWPQLSVSTRTDLASHHSAYLTGSGYQRTLPKQLERQTRRHPSITDEVERGFYIRTDSKGSSTNTVITKNTSLDALISKEFSITRPSPHARAGKQTPSLSQDEN